MPGQRQTQDHSYRIARGRDARAGKVSSAAKRKFGMWVIMGSMCMFGLLMLGAVPQDFMAQPYQQDLMAKTYKHVFMAEN